MKEIFFIVALALFVPAMALGGEFVQITEGQSIAEGECVTIKRIDSIFKRVLKILGAPAPAFIINIVIFDSQKQMSKKYQNLAKVADDNIYAFYWHETKTVYLQKDRLAVGIIAHEIAHAIVRHFFVIKPSVEIDEIISQHIDRVITGSGI
ncbi:hypothetical protein KAR91_26030 [Candidatus Pacearchaeota archaeon]|nr:hypothetical protein [Candidatus Pacearchaeota archaeon]